MHCQQINGRDYSSSLFGTGEAASGHCIWFETPHCKGGIDKQKQTRGGSGDGGWKMCTCVWGGYVWPGCRSRACSAAGKETPGSRGHLLWPKGVLEMLGPDPAPKGTVRALEAPAQVVAPDTAPRRQPFPCKQGVSVLRDNPDALGRSPK